MINNKPSPIAFYRPLINRLPEFILHITAQTANQFLALTFLFHNIRKLLCGLNQLYVFHKDQTISYPPALSGKALSVSA
nr:MAG TPA: hypothetical protein [Caudoviricetes sp.]